MCQSLVKTVAAALVLMGLAAVAVAAEKVYKSIDADGGVTYSSVPPPDLQDKDVRSMSLDAGPDDATRREAEQRSRSMGARARQDRQRQEAGRKQREEQAARERPDAESRKEPDEADAGSPSGWRQRLGVPLEP